MKPHITKWKKLWECTGEGIHSFGNTPKESHERWLVFVKQMKRVHK